MEGIFTDIPEFKLCLFENPEFITRVITKITLATGQELYTINILVKSEQTVKVNNESIKEVMYSIVSIPTYDLSKCVVTQIDMFSNVKSSSAHFCKLRNELIVMTELVVTTELLVGKEVKQNKKDVK